jgi:AGCS family alanine or glycine:cation symporter
LLRLTTGWGPPRGPAAAWLNIVAILILFFMSKPAITALRDYEQQRKAGVTNYTFDPEKLGIRNADFWK